jgi:hypothetical protein
MNYYCYFCSGRCIKITIQPGDWWRCAVCCVEFKEGPESLEAMSFSVRKPNTMYIIELLFTQNKTRVRALHSETGLFNGLDMYKPPILEISELIQGVNPQNVKEKLQTLLTFA